MIITCNPVRSDQRPEVARHGDTLVVNGARYDFAPLGEGDVLPAGATDCPWLTGEITRRDGRVRLMLILPHGANAPPDTLFPAPLMLTGDGPVDLPPFDLPAAQAAIIDEEVTP